MSVIKYKNPKTGIWEKTSGGSGGTSIDVTAEVGQTIIVKEVDGNGKPTKWEAVDFQERTHWSEGIKEVETLAEMSFAGMFDSTIGAYAYVRAGLFSLKEGHQYKVIFDGVEYSGLEARVASLNGETGTAIGNFSMVGGGGADIPFVAVLLSNGFAGFFIFDDNEHTSQIFEIVEDVQKIPTKFIPTLEEMRVGGDVILPETTLTESHAGGFLIPADLDLKVGQEYSVRYNGVEYVVSNGIADGGEFAIGNFGVLNPGMLPNTGEPFVIVYTDIQNADGSTSLCWALIPVDGSSSVTLSIKQGTILPIPRDYLVNALPYYIEVTGDGTEEDPFACNETFADIVALYGSGREIKVKGTTNTSGDIYQTIILNCVAVVVDSGSTTAIMFSAALYGSYNSVIVFTPNEDGSCNISNNLD